MVPTNVDAVVLPATKPLIRRLAAYSRTAMPVIVRSFVDEIADPRHGLVPVVDLPADHLEL